MEQPKDFVDENVGTNQEVTEIPLVVDYPIDGGCPICYNQCSCLEN